MSYLAALGWTLAVIGWGCYLIQRCILRDYMTAVQRERDTEKGIMEGLLRVAKLGDRIEP